ncbi:hypothetical protein Ga0074812_111154 [Parafrankia irregularis]|uniref:Putative membrane protein insertion efficiency factor n=1 Tax=Parafrankia irregularis TaxID=795642 RepID=A0A0S4QSC9_9ACTN|nr:hypothetical protein Ga0074812_111154 [Parafrankia irregularis]
MARYAGILVVLMALVDLVFAAPITARRFPTLARTSDQAVRGPLAWALTALVRLYRAGWSARNAGCCRFEPSCSAYALTALRRHGGVVGGLLALRRLLRCQPLSAGGYDPVPGVGSGGAGSPGRGPAAPSPTGIDRATDVGRADVARADVARAAAGPGHRTASPLGGTRSEIVGSRRGTRV